MGFFWNNSKSKYTTAKCCTSFESIFYSKSAGNWALRRNEPFKSHGPQNPQLKFKKYFFKSILLKMMWFCLKIVIFYILTVFRANLKLPIWKKKVLFSSILDLFRHNFELLLSKTASLMSFEGIQLKKLHFFNFEVFLLVPHVHCAWESKYH